MILAAALLLLCTATDGDSLKCGDMRVRLAEIDAPELREWKCTAERDLAEKARDYVAEFVREPVQIIPTGERERYGRTLAHVRRDGRDLGAELKAAGLARRWEGRRMPWCD